jgi:uncharacterized protein (TIGR02231 family)
MKNLFLSVCLIGFAQAFAGSDTEKKIKHDIKDVTVFLAGAQVTNSGSITLSQGKWDIVFDELASQIDINSIQAKGEGDLVILSVMHRYNYLNPDIKTKDIKLLEDSLQSLTDKLDLLKAMRDVYGEEQKMILANKSIGGQNTGVNVTELEKGVNLLRARLTEIQLKLLESKQKEKKLSETISKINNQLAEMNSKKNKTTSEIIVSVSVKNAVTAKLTINYLAPAAGWTPYYDIRAIDNNSPIKLDYKANVWQSTGNDWKDVKLTLSTGNPSQSGTQPTLTPWYLSYYTPYYDNYKQKNSGYYNNMPPQNAPQEMQMDKVGDITVTSKTTGTFTNMTENQVNTLFDISIPYTIPSDAKQYSVEIQNFTIPATYKYYAAPKLDRDAFLLASITGWDKLNLLTGEANIFYEGTYVGKSFINTRSTSDTLSISLGRDKNVVVTRIKLAEFCEKKTLGLQKKETLTYEITVRNKKKQDIDIHIDDQIPLSNIKEIEVELMESSDAKYDAQTGKLTWKFKMPSGDVKKVKISFSVKYPKDKVLGNL